MGRSPHLHTFFAKSLAQAEQLPFFVEFQVKRLQPNKLNGLSVLQYVAKIIGLTILVKAFMHINGVIQIVDSWVETE